MTLPSQQFCLYGTLFNVYDTLIKHALRLTLNGVYPRATAVLGFIPTVDDGHNYET